MLISSQSVDVIINHGNSNYQARNVLTVQLLSQQRGYDTKIREIRNKIEIFIVNINKEGAIFFQDGPMVPDVAPREASDRLIIFQNRFDTLDRKYQTYSGGEVLFGLPTTEHPELLQVPTEWISLVMSRKRMQRTWQRMLLGTTIFGVFS